MPSIRFMNFIKIHIVQSCRLLNASKWTTMLKLQQYLRNLKTELTMFVPGLHIVYENRMKGWHLVCNAIETLFAWFSNKRWLDSVYHWFLLLFSGSETFIGKNLLTSTRTKINAVCTLPQFGLLILLNWTWLETLTSASCTTSHKA